MGRGLMTFPHGYYGNVGCGWRRSDQVIAPGGSGGGELRSGGGLRVGLWVGQVERFDKAVAVGQVSIGCVFYQGVAAPLGTGKSEHSSGL